MLNKDDQHRLLLATSLTTFCNYDKLHVYSITHGITVRTIKKYKHLTVSNV